MTGNDIVRVSQSFILFKDLFLMQLRDFDTSIESPGEWGFFAGHIEGNESAEEAMWRELYEELIWVPNEIMFLGTSKINDREINNFVCRYDGTIDDLTLMEGEDIGVFSETNILSRKLYSKKLKKYFKTTDISRVMFAKYFS